MRTCDHCGQLVIIGNVHQCKVCGPIRIDPMPANNTMYAKQ